MAKTAVVLFVVVCLSLHLTLTACAKEPSPSRKRWFQEEEYQNFFISYIQQFSKGYNAFEFRDRYDIYKETLDWIAEFNSNKNGRTYEVGENEFSDMTNDEFRNIILMKNFQPAPRRANEIEYTGEGERVARVASRDWRQLGAVTAVKNQGQCGSCWTFGAAGAIESTYKISTNISVVLSEQNLLDCETRSSGCDGGVPQYALQWVVDNGGIATGASYPYEGKKGVCRYPSAPSGQVKGADITGVTRVQATEAALEAAVTNQPVVVAIDAGQTSFQSYKSGIYNDALCTTNLNHAVLAVGFDTDASGNQYWIIKNSWGTGWGQAGYFNLQKGVNKCGVANQAVFPTRTGGTTPAPTSAPTKGPTSAPTSAPSKAPTLPGGATVAPTKAPTAGPTGIPSKAPTAGPTTIGATPDIYRDALLNGWVLTSLGSVSGLNLKGVAQSGSYGVFATVSTNGQLIFSHTPAFAWSGFTKLNFAIKGSAAGTVQVSFTSNIKATVPVQTGWLLYNVQLSQMAGSLTSISAITFTNSGASLGLGIDNVYFS